MPCRAVKEFLVGMGFDADSVSAVLREEPDVDRALALLLCCCRFIHNKIEYHLSQPIKNADKKRRNSN